MDVVVAACSVRGNRLLLAQLVANLLANAVTYNVPGGSVEVSLTGEGALRVRNTGPVVSEADIAGFFEPFRRGEGRDRMGRGRASVFRSSARSRWPTAVRSRRDRARRAAVSP